MGDGTNSSAIGEEVKTVSFDYNGDGSATSAEVIEETGSTTWTWMDGDTEVTETIQFVNYYSNDEDEPTWVVQKQKTGLIRFTMAIVVNRS